MRSLTPAAVTVCAVALAVLPSVAAAHEGQHPFKNCSAAYEAGHANIPQGDAHYGGHLDRDKDGVGCDKPPSGFVPAEDESESSSGAKEDKTPGSSSSSESASGEESSAEGSKALAETGGDSATPYVAGAGAAVLLGGAGLLVVARRRRSAG